jgi:predicted dehydrogenase
MWRFDTEVNYARRLVASGKLGRIYRGTAYGVHENWGPSGWFLDPELSGGGALVDMGVHAIDTIRYILGDPRPLSVYARIGSERPEYTVDDSGILMVVWEGGISTVIYSGWWQAHAEAPEAGVRLWGSEGFLSVFPTRFKTMIAGSPGECTPVLPPREEHCGQVLYNAQMESFCGSISGGGPAHPGSGEGLTVMRIVAAAYASAAGGGVVALAGGAGTA